MFTVRHQASGLFTTTFIKTCPINAQFLRGPQEQGGSVLRSCSPEAAGLSPGWIKKGIQSLNNPLNFHECLLAVVTPEKGAAEKTTTKIQDLFVLHWLFMGHLYIIEQPVVGDSYLKSTILFQNSLTLLHIHHSVVNIMSDLQFAVM